MPANWETLRVALETMMATQDISPEDLVSYFRNFEARLKQIQVESPSMSRSKAVALPILDASDDESKMDLLVRQFRDFRNRERRFNDNRKDQNLKPYCFECNKKGHTIETCWTLHPEHVPWNKKDDDRKDRDKRNSRPERRRDVKGRDEKNREKGKEYHKKKAYKARVGLWGESDD